MRNPAGYYSPIKLNKLERADKENKMTTKTRLTKEDYSMLLLMTEFYSPVPDYDSDKTKGHALGVLRSIHQAKYKKFARPGDILDIKIELLLNIETSFRFKAFIECQGEKIMSNEFTLINISEAQLAGSI